MAKKALAALTLVSLILSNCIVTSGSYDEICEPVRTSIPGGKHITYSINLRQEISNAAMRRSNNLLLDYFITNIGDELLRSNMYASVTYTAEPINSANHYHFDINVQGVAKGKREFLGFIHGFSCAMLPVWYTQNIDITLAAHGISFQTEQYARTYHWAPLLLAAPFANGKTLVRDLSKRSVAFFLTEIEKRNLHR